MQSICDHLVNEVNTGRRDCLRRIKFVYVERDPDFIEQTEITLKEKAVSTSNAKLSTTDTSITTNFSGSSKTFDDDGSVSSIYIDDDVISPSNITPTRIRPLQARSDPLSLQLLNLPSCATTTEDVYDSEMEQDNVLEGDGFQPKDICVPDLEDGTGKHTALTGEDVLDLELYLTSSKPNEVISFDPCRKNIHYGRPNISEIFLRMKRDVLVESFLSLSDGTNPTIDDTTIGQHRIAVCISAPRSLTNACRKACLMYSDDNVRFDFHYESMST
jgi:hypothetical protein